MSLKPYPKYKDSGVAWLGDVPERWERRPLFSLVRELDERNDGMKEDNLLSLSYGQIKRKDINDNDGLLPASFETYQIVERDDIVWRLTDLQNDQRSLRTGLVRERGIITSAYLATRPIMIRPHYLAYLLRAYDQTKVFYSMGGGLRQSMKFSDVKWLPVILPSPDEQAAIAAFLDRETAKIDDLIAEQEKLIALLAEKRQATISHAVTKGLNPDAPMKDSGVEWLGEIPAHWEVTRLKSIAIFEDGDRSSNYPNENDLTNDGIPFLSSKNIVNYLFDLSETKFISTEKFSTLTRGRAVQGDLIITVRGTIGHVAMFEPSELGFETAFINAQMMIVRPTRISGRFLILVTRSSTWQQQLEVGSYGTAQQQLSNQVLAEVRLALPPDDEAEQITEFLTAELSRLDDLSNEATRVISLLKERRTALISAAVTGKIDVRDAVSTSEAA